MLTRALLFVILLVQGMVIYAQDNQTDWLNYSLKSLDSANRISLQQYKGKPILMSFFEPECSWCFKQLRDLSQLQSNCQDRFQTLAMGVNGSQGELRQLYARTGVKLPAFLVSSRMIVDIGDIPATPITLLINESGQAISAVRGYQSLEKLQDVLRKFAPDTFNQCLQD
jgi:thioredoxin-related protein